MDFVSIDPQAQSDRIIARRRYATLLRQGSFVAAAAHFVFLIFFYLLGSKLLTVFNVGSVIFYLALSWTLRGSLAREWLLVAMLEVIVHAGLAVFAVGWESGFHYYLFVLAPLVMFHPGWKLISKIGLAALICAIFLALHYSAETPYLPVDGTMLGVLHGFNAVASFAFVAHLSLYYSQAVDSAEMRLSVLASTDPLTGLQNRRSILELAQYELTRHKRNRKPLSVIIVDADDFKQINDRLGHEAGDAVLKNLGEKLTQLTRRQDGIARWGGEEFLLLLPETEMEGARALAEKIRTAVQESPMVWKDEYVSLTLTLGVSERMEGESLEGCLVRADRALLEGKRAGKNQVRTAEAPMVRTMTGLEREG